jgi:hypothetical protein
LVYVAVLLMTGAAVLISGAAIGLSDGQALIFQIGCGLRRGRLLEVP